jgi:hypothetical protein
VFRKGIRFVVGADLDAAVRAAIGMIPDTAWRPYRDGHIAETVHTMNKTHNAFRLIVVRKRVQGSLPGLPTEPPSFETRYKVWRRITRRSPNGCWTGTTSGETTPKTGSRS